MKRGEIIRGLREEHKMTQIELAKRIGTSKQNIYKYECGIITNIPSDKVEAIADLFNVSPAYVMGWIRYKDISELISDSNFPVSEHEKELVQSYRKHPQFQEAIDTMLHIENSKAKARKHG